MLSMFYLSVDTAAWETGSLNDKHIEGAAVCSMHSWEVFHLNKYSPQLTACLPSHFYISRILERAKETPDGYVRALSWI